MIEQLLKNCTITMDAIDAGGHRDSYADIKNKIKHLVFQVQENLCEELEGLDGLKFSRTEWTTEGGRGVTKYLENEHDGAIEKVGVCASEVEGILPTSVILKLKDRFVNKANLNSSEVKFFTAGVSGVVYALQVR